MTVAIVTLPANRLARRWNLRRADGSEFGPLAYVISKNFHPRHPNFMQRAMVAVRVRGIFIERTKKRQIRKPVDSVPETLPEQNNGVEHITKALSLRSRSRGRPA